MIGQSWYFVCGWSELVLCGWSDLVLSLWLVRVGTLFVVGQSWYFVIAELVLLCACLALVVYDYRVGTSLCLFSIGSL